MNNFASNQQTLADISNQNIEDPNSFDAEEMEEDELPTNIDEITGGTPAHRITPIVAHPRKVVHTNTHRAIICKVIDTLFELSDGQPVCITYADMITILILATPREHQSVRIEMVFKAFNNIGNATSMFKAQLRRVHKVLMVESPSTGKWHLIKEAHSIEADPEDYRMIVVGK